MTLSLLDNDHAPIFTTPSDVTVLENSTLAVVVQAVDMDQPPQLISYHISGGADQLLFTIDSSGEVSFVAAPDFESPQDANHDNIYTVEVTADDGSGGTTSQTLTITVQNLAEAPALIIGGPAVTWIKRQAPVAIVPQLTVSGSGLGGGTLTFGINAVGSSKKSLDQLVVPSWSNLGTSAGVTYGNGRLTMTIQLQQSVSASAVQSFLRGLGFTTKGKGLKTLSRSFDIALTDVAGAMRSARQTIQVQKKA